MSPPLISASISIVHDMQIFTISPLAAICAGVSLAENCYHPNKPVAVFKDGR